MRVALLLLAVVLLAGAAAATTMEPAGYGYNITITYMPVWWTFALTDPKTVTSYNFTAWADFSHENNSWYILGSNDGLTFAVLDERINVPLSQGVNTSFTLATNGSYKYYYGFMFTGFGTGGEKLEVHMFAGTEEVIPASYYLNVSQEQPVEPVLPVAAAAVVGWYGKRRIRL